MKKVLEKLSELQRILGSGEDKGVETLEIPDVREQTTTANVGVYPVPMGPPLRAPSIAGIPRGKPTWAKKRTERR